LTPNSLRGEEENKNISALQSFYELMATMDLNFSRTAVKILEAKGNTIGDDVYPASSASAVGSGANTSLRM